VRIVWITDMCVTAGLILDRVTHTPLQRYAQRTLFAPLGMRSTSFALERLSGDYAHGHEPDVGPFHAPPAGLAIPNA
jgi:CubicO group peptidase (beta-lactamase class C family)